MTRGSRSIEKNQVARKSFSSIAEDDLDSVDCENNYFDASGKRKS